MGKKASDDEIFQITFQVVYQKMTQRLRNEPLEEMTIGFMPNCYSWGAYQIGEVYARSWVIIGISAGKLR